MIRTGALDVTEEAECEVQLLCFFKSGKLLVILTPRKCA